MTTGERIKALRIAKGWSQEELGKKIGVQRAAINKYEKGVVVNLKRDVIAKLASALDASPIDIMGFEPATEETEKNSEAIADLASRMLADANFFSLVNDLSKLDETRLQDARDMLNLLFKQSLNQNKN